LNVNFILISESFTVKFYSKSLFRFTRKEAIEVDKGKEGLEERGDGTGEPF
jgi:hypothetical protein